MGCVHSSEPQTPGIPDSRTMLARPKVRVLGVIPARYESSSGRFPGKPLTLIGGQPMIWHVYASACRAKCLDYCCVATDDPRIEKAVRAFGGEVVMTDPKCENGAERCLDVYRKLKKKLKKGVSFDAVVQVACDEPFIQPHHIEIVANIVAGSDDAVMGALVRRTEDDEAAEEEDDGVVDEDDNLECELDTKGYAVHFYRGSRKNKKINDGDASRVDDARANIDDGVTHTIASGIYGYRADFLARIVKLSKSRAAAAASAGLHRGYTMGKQSAAAGRGRVGRPAKSSSDAGGDGCGGLLLNRVIRAGHGVRAEKMDDAEAGVVRGVKTAAQAARVNQALREGKLVMPK